MTHPSTRFAFLALLAAVTAAACDSTPVACPCPSSGAYVALPVTDSATIETVTTDPSCSASATDDSHISIGRPNDGTCQVTARLTNGDVYVFTVQFRAGGGCCSHGVYATNTPVPTLVDAGTGD